MKTLKNKIDAINVMYKLFFSALFLIVLWCLLCISSLVIYDDSVAFKILCGSIFILGLFRPFIVIGAFLILAPFFGGSRPNDLHTIRFYIFFSSICLSLSLNLFQEFLCKEKKIECNFSHPLVFALLCYWLTTALSLVSVKANEIVSSIFYLKPNLIKQFLNLSENSVLYPWLSGFILTLSMLFGLLIINFAKTPKKMCQLLGCFLFGLLLTVFLGLLDYYDVINLNSIRPSFFSEFFGENFRFKHLTSLFGHPGWYAQYLVLGAPALLVILGLDWQRRWKIFSLVLLTVITEFCIILVYQRGGWISYPITLMIIWFCVYVLDRGDDKVIFRAPAIRGAIVKIAITLPLTIMITICVIYFTARMQPEVRQQPSGFLERAQAISSTNERLRYFEPAFLMARLHPFFGPGVDSFSSQYEKLYLAPGHLYTISPENNLNAYYGSAHNLYFQAMAGKGFIGLLSLFSVFISVLMLVWHGIFGVKRNDVDLSLSQRLLLMMTLAYTCALAIYGNVGEIFYTPIGYVLFALFFSASIGSVPASFNLSSRFRFSVLAFLLVCFILHLYFEFF